MELPHTDAYYYKQISKLIHRIERIIVPSNTVIHSNASSILENLLNLVKEGVFYESIHNAKGKHLGKLDENKPKRVNWDKLEQKLLNIISSDIKVSSTQLFKINEEIAIERRFQKDEDLKLKTKNLQERNDQAILPGPWRKKPFPIRRYQKLNDYAITESISSEESTKIKNQLTTDLDGFLGPPYNYDDQGLTEEWMVSYKITKDNIHKKGALAASEDVVIRYQLENLLDIMVAQVCDRQCNSMKILSKGYVGLGSRLKEVPVWGVDSYTRRMIELVLEDNLEAGTYTAEGVQAFLQRDLFPTINAMPPQLAHNILYSLHHIKTTPSETRKQTPAQRNISIVMAETVHKAVLLHGPDLFKIHPKGTGVVCCCSEGIQPHVVVSDYLGEIYPPYRWCERLDVVTQAQKTYSLKPTLPDFYNILLERPRQDGLGGYGLLFVDASRKANMGSSCSHSCDANCTSAIVAKDGKLVIVLTTVRHQSFTHCTMFH